MNAWYFERFAEREPKPSALSTIASWSRGFSAASSTIPSVNWWTMKSFCGSSCSSTSWASHAEVALTSRASTDPIT